ncbi:hypothetical protein BCV71DRAFT_167615, partial [Rhizopus microsporus]
DYAIDIYNNRTFAFSNRIGEIKLSNVVESGQQIEFYRTAVFSKERLEKLCVVINFYIGSAVSFFGVNLFFDKLYTYTELESINFPMKKTEM